ncbi:polysaccharide biosynthesis/export family protein [Porphyrobacter sp. AAP60]|uniref:polysaccharide biosynthesis/export family protein n=1 Tax=Porphyrobacter sp. AAP60 TaxID=1523423 RepID=UPI001F2585AB|nr:polysaccharide biosynthesis/export family protein [Porphyrobacter sp. AAP60]
MTGTRMSFDNPAASAHHAARRTRRSGFVAALLLATALAGCTSLGSSGPPAGAIRDAQGADFAGADIRVVDLSPEVAQGLSATARSESFAKAFGDGAPVGTVIGAGDVLDVSVWEAPPAALFGMFGQPTGAAAATDTTLAKETDLPQQMVDADGLVSLPFIGRLPAAGRTPRQLENDITARLRGIANQPQVSVGLMRNASANVNVVGKVVTNGRVPLTPRGERLLDVIAVAGGVAERLERTSIQITRDNQVVTMPMDTIVRDPRQNIRLQPDDVVTALYQPYSFTALGAVGMQSEVDFEATGITLSQAMGRVSGLQDTRANVKGVFVFRLEDPSRLDPAVVSGARLMPDGTLPVIYRIDLSDPRGVFLMQSFQMHNRDVLYVSNAPGVDLQRFVTILSQIAFSLIGITNAVAPGN